MRRDGSRLGAPVVLADEPTEALVERRDVLRPERRGTGEEPANARQVGDRGHPSREQDPVLRRHAEERRDGCLGEHARRPAWHERLLQDERRAGVQGLEDAEIEPVAVRERDARENARRPSRGRAPPRRSPPRRGRLRQ